MTTITRIEFSVSKYLIILNQITKIFLVIPHQPCTPYTRQMSSTYTPI
ncbi:hypothetical protein PBCV1_a682bR [Paramecium bursaria Chlorella virus 1]|uniref:Uncharacterized protein n=1 Tax=Paramecium bursaria Chlorella virus 1 TaxID=10506 RepID=F8TU85_PBCV1|nr:hypothetical protein PBCV1_a682bR [Paramecium bursaria Chlorella virus 1]AEI70146.1 hypothetical protein [Paramecium bursaria Chlorella virus 1]